MAPGITAMDASGHTPGQCVFVIAQGNGKLSFPALGYSEKSGNGYRMVPVAWNPTL